jgi:hypothetical protein
MSGGATSTAVLQIHSAGSPAPHGVAEAKVKRIAGPPGGSHDPVKDDTSRSDWDRGGDQGPRDAAVGRG